MRIVLACLFLALIGLQYKLWLGDGSIREWFTLEKKLASTETENKKLELRNRAMEAEIEELKSGDQALEAQARYEMGMIKEGETYYHIVDSGG